MNGDIADGYRQFIQDLGGEFLRFADNYIKCIEIARNNEMLGEDTKLKVRIKDYSSSYRNTENKLLDDMFGMELVTSTEEEKEFLILFNHLLFNMRKDKKFEKENGYDAYHFIGDYNLKIDNLDEDIRKILNDSTTKLYTDNPLKLADNNQTKTTRIFTRLPQMLENEDEYNLLKDTLKQMLEEVEKSSINTEELPWIEFHFFTSLVEQSAIRGTASHSNYKDTNAELIEGMFRRGQLYRGINTPWKFTSKDGELVLQNFYETLIENWPFLRKDIVQRRRDGYEEQDIENNNNCDKLLATQYDFLQNYVECDDKLKKKSKEEMWGALKQVMLLYKIDNNSKDEDFAKLQPRIINSLFNMYGLTNKQRGE